MQKSNIYLVESANRQDLAETFMRFQEYYESPVFAGKTFSVEEFSSWYSRQYGAFTYAQDWSGFNIPSWVLEPFKRGDFGPLTDKEKNFLNFFKNKNEDFYIIGVTSGDEWCADTLKHEFVHGSFFSNADYRNEVLRCLSAHRPDAIKVALQEMGYGKNVLEDEVNAYILTEPETLAETIGASDGKTMRSILDKIFRKYFGFSMIGVSADFLANGTERLSI